MAVFVNREGNLSMLRIGIALVGFGVVVIIGGFLLFQIEQQRYKSPLSIDTYPEAQELGINRITSTAREVIYTVTDTDPSTVADFYDDLLIEHEGTSANDINREQCLRFPPGDGEIFDDFQEGTGVMPYFYRCIFNDTGFNASRLTQVTVAPGVLNNTTGNDFRGLTMITYEQQWEP